MYVHLNYSICNLSLLFCSVATMDRILNKKISQDSLFEEGRHRNEQKSSFSFIRVEFFFPFVIIFADAANFNPNSKRLNVEFDT